MPSTTIMPTANTTPPAAGIGAPAVAAASPAPAALPDATPADDPLWYKDAVIYQLNVKAFFDSNNDGVGDFPGVTAKLDYVKSLGVNTVWLMPFYPSPMRDDGYDIAAYEDVHPPYGTLDDFRTMLAEAHRIGLKVITELVINHTSDQHPWFQAARRAPPGSPEREFYVWSESDKKYDGTRIIFTDTEVSNWTYDPVAKAYFWHRFFSHQPDLNFDNPKVLEAIFKTMRFWLDMGVDGFRLDAIPYLIEREGTNNENLPETHVVIKKLRAAIDASYTNRFLLAEANQWPEDVREYFGDGDECHAAYHFPLMPRMYMAIAQEDRFPLTEIMAQTPEIPANCQWAIFLRNHDELTLEMVTSRERDYMYSTYAADPRARINLGIRRRLAPLLDNDTDRIKLMNSLLLSMRGSPIIYYGDELGMGDNVFIGDRNGVRTPMQWSPDRNAGFSRADPQRLYLPPVMDAVYGFGSVNVEAQLREPSSLLNWMRRMLAVRATSRAFGRGSLVFLKPGNRKILAYLREHEGETIFCVANLSATAQPVELDLSAFKGRVPVELLGRTAFPPIGDLPYLVTIAAHGFYWFRLTTDVAVPSWHDERLAVENRPVMILSDGWKSLFIEQVSMWRSGAATRMREQFETDALPHHVEAQRWYAAKGETITRARMGAYARWGDAWLLEIVQIETAAAASTATANSTTPAAPIAITTSPAAAMATAIAATGDTSYFVPLALAWEDKDDERLKMMTGSAVARVRQQAQVGVMADALADESFCRAVVEAIGRGDRIASSSGEFRFEATHAFASIAGDDIASLAVGRPHAQSSNSIVTLGDRLFLKAYRRVRPGRNPEFEMGCYLTDAAHFANAVPVAGVLEHIAADGTVRTLAIVQAHVANQGDGWNLTLDYLKRFIESSRSVAEIPADVHATSLERAVTLGARTAELHNALVQSRGHSAFDPEPMTAADIGADRDRVLADLERTCSQLGSALARLPDATRPLAEAVLAARPGLEVQIRAITATTSTTTGLRKIRIHGDYHLGQVLVTKNDFVIIDFEGEPGRDVDERRVRQSPLRDVAGMLRSFSYAHHSALRDGVAGGSDPLTTAALLDDWEARTRAAFIEGYGAAVDTSLWPDGSADGRGLLGLYVLEKALYEVRYELDNRPDWVGIPLQGVLTSIAA